MVPSDTTQALFQYKDYLSKYVNYHDKNKTIVRLMFYHYNGNHYANKMVFMMKRPRVHFSNNVLAG